MERTISVPLTDFQRLLYASLLKHDLEGILGVGTSAASTGKPQFARLNGMVMQLRKVTCRAHPAHLYCRVALSLLFGDHKVWRVTVVRSPIPPPRGRSYGD